MHPHIESIRDHTLVIQFLNLLFPGALGPTHHIFILRRLSACAPDTGPQQGHQMHKDEENELEALSRFVGIFSAD